MEIMQENYTPCNQGERIMGIGQESEAFCITAGRKKLDDPQKPLIKKQSVRYNKLMELNDVTRLVD